MDLADDIAYSTYDLEDAFKAGFLSPISMAGANNNQKQVIVDVINRKMKEEYGNDIFKKEKMKINNLDSIIATLFDDIFRPSAAIYDRAAKEGIGDEELSYALSAEAYSRSDVLREDGYSRSEFTSKLVNAAISNVELIWNEDNPAISKVRFNVISFKVVEILKRFAYESLIESNRLKMVDRRGKEIIEKIFTALSEKGGDRLLPDDVRKVYLASKNIGWHKRVICDFIASMTDRYCVEFYSRLTGINVPSIYKPF